MKIPYFGEKVSSILDKKMFFICNKKKFSKFFDKQTILKQINKHGTIHPMQKNYVQSYLDWFSNYINDMYTLINNTALGKNDKKKCWQAIFGQGNEKINFNNDIQNAILKKLINTDFLNNRNPAIDGRGLIKDINETMKYLAECSLKIYNGQINVQNINRIIAVYDQLREYM